MNKKSNLLPCICGILVITAVSGCAATGTPRVISNSKGYDYKIQTPENLEKKIQPDWVSSYENFEKIRTEAKKSGKELFLGKSILEWSKWTKDGTDYWSEEQATTKAWSDAMNQVSSHVSTQITSQYDEKVNSIQKGEEKTKDGLTKAELKEQYNQEIISWESSSRSSAALGGVREILKYTQTEEQTIIEKKTQRTITASQCWIIYEITEDEIKEARVNAIKYENLVNWEKETFEALQKQYGVIINGDGNNIGLKDIDISIDEATYLVRYDSLLFVNARLRTLITLETLTDKVGDNYRDVLQKTTEDIRAYNPSTRQSKVIQDLRNQIDKKDAEIARIKDDILKEMRDNRQGVSVQTNFIAFPQKPYEVGIQTVNIFAANDMVTNLDYISFCSLNGRNSYSKAEQGLYSPVTSVSWDDAARYCNWLSKLYGLKPCYDESNNRISAYNNGNNGYRLPEEHEISAMLDSGNKIIDTEQMSQIGIWGSAGFPQGSAYILASGSGQAVDRLLKQSLSSASSDAAIGFRIVRNAE